MGIYGKYTKIVTVVSYGQIVVGGLMIALGIAFRVLVCSWVTDAAFGFWVGFLVLFGGIIGYCSATKDNYSYIGVYVGLNSFCIMFASLVIFCHSIASVYFNDQMQISSDFNNTTGLNATSSSPINKYTTNAPGQQTSTKMDNSTINTTITPNSSTTSRPSTIPGEVGPRCYTHQTWSDYENGARGMGLAATMIFVCFVEILMCVLSSACCWATTKIQPTGITRRKVTIQGTVSEILSAESLELTAIRRRGTQYGSRSSTTNIYDNVYVIPRETTTSTTDVREHSVDNVYETIPNTSASTTIPDDPVANWYSTIS